MNWLKNFILFVSLFVIFGYGIQYSLGLSREYTNGILVGYLIYIVYDFIRYDEEDENE